MLMSCNDHDEIVVSGESVRVELAYTLSSAVSGSNTRQADELVQNTSQRQPSSLNIIAMQGDKLMRSDVSWEEPVSKPGVDPKPASVLYHSHFCDMASGVNRCLVYGDVADAPSGDILSKVYNGSLIKSSLNAVTTQSDLNQISFSLEPIYKSTDYESTGGVPDGATSLATVLTTIANRQDWVGSDNDVLKNLRQNFLNHGFNLPGSAASVKKWLESLASGAQGYLGLENSSFTESETAILGEIQTAATTAAGTISIDDVSHPPYPRNLYLPDGAAALRWVESASEFQPEMQTTTLDNINSVSRFAYPAALYYFVDSSIKTSEEKVDFEEIYRTVTTTKVQTAWEQVLSNDKFTKTSVSTKTKAIAVKEPVQYAVAQLHVTLKASPTVENGTTIKDDADKDITIGTSDFKLTGVIVCGQRPVNYLFEQDSNSDVNVKFIYDSQVVKDCYLTTTTKDACNTLVLQSFGGEDVNIILEFENKGTQTFKCVDGYVYPGTRFYLAGKVDCSTPASGSDAINNGRVFTKDYITTVNMVVTSLAKAYNVLPNLLTSNLEIGVQTNPQWIAVTPTVIRME